MSSTEKTESAACRSNGYHLAEVVTAAAESGGVEMDRRAVLSAVAVAVAALGVAACTTPTVTSGKAVTTTAPSSASTTAQSSAVTNSTAPPTSAPPSNSLNPLGTPVSIPNTLSGIDKVTVAAWYPGVADSGQYTNTPAAGHTWDAIDATACAGSKGSSTGPTESDFSVLLNNGSTAPVSNNASGSTFAGPLASLSELGASSSGLSPGQCERGWVVFSIPPGTTPTAIEFSGTSAGLTTANSVVKWAVS